MTLGCLSVTGLPSNQGLEHAQVPTPDPSHRGSGRVVTQVPQTLSPGLSYSYRGTGRIHQGTTEPVAHRGSGRSPQGHKSPSLSYRGSGRVAPHPVNATRWA